MLATLIGDLVESRHQADRRLTQERVVKVLDEVNRLLPADQPLAPTVGDEFQAVYGTVADAVLASLMVRLRLRESVDCRFGLGWGELEIFSHHQGVPTQDGPGWWAARDAIDDIRGVATHKRFRNLRTRFKPSEPMPWTQFINGFLMCRDSSIAKLTPRGDRILFGLITNQTQAQIAELEQVTDSAVSQYVERNGLASIAAAHRPERGVTPWSF